MTRFNLFLQDGINTVMWALNNTNGGEIVVPRAKSIKINEVAKIIGSKCKIKIIGKRPGEKLHEELISSAESYSSIDLGKYILILPENSKKILNIILRNLSSKIFLKIYHIIVVKMIM